MKIPLIQLTVIVALKSHSRPAAEVLLIGIVRDSNDFCWSCWYDFSIVYKFIETDNIMLFLRPIQRTVLESPESCY